MCELLTDEKVLVSFSAVNASASALTCTLLYIVLYKHIPIATTIPIAAIVLTTAIIVYRVLNYNAL